MLFRSTGLGKTELVAEIDSLRRQGDYLILHVNTLEPVRWKIRAALSFRDLARVVGAMIKASIIGFILSPRQWFKKEPKHPGDF